MSAFTFGVINFVSVFGAAMTGMFLSTVLPEDHLSPESKDAIKITVGLVSTMAALLLGLLIASAKSSFDTQQNRVIEMAAQVSFVDRTLSSFGPAAAESRMLLRKTVGYAIERLWPADRTSLPELRPFTEGGDGDILYASIQALAPKDDIQATAKALALESAAGTARLFSLIFAQATMRISSKLLVVVVFWVVAIFLSFGLVVPRNGTVIAALLVSAAAVSTALFLVVDLDSSFGGLIGVSGDPLRKAHEQLGE